MTRHPIHLARAYDPPEVTEGARLLIDRLWPRGVTRAALAPDAWLKAAAPSDELRRWFHADPSRWEDFVVKYRAELDSGNGAEECLDWCRRGPVVLLYAARDRERNHAMVLRDWLTERLEEEA